MQHRFATDQQESHYPASFKGHYVPGTGYMLGWGTALPSTEGWAAGALFQVVSASAAALYKNDGTSTTASWTAISLEGGQEDFGSGGLKTDVISESTSATGVTIDSALIKDGGATLTEVLAGDTALGITGKAVTAGTGGSVVIAGGATTTSGVGGLTSVTGGAGAGTDLGGAASLVGGVGGSTGAIGGAADVTGGAGTATSAGAVATLKGGASGGGATGNGGNAAATGGAAASTNGSGGSVVLTGGAKTGTGIAGGVFTRSNAFQTYAAPGAGADQAEVLTAAGMINAIFVHTISTGRTLTTPTGAAITAGCPAEAATGDTFLFHLITVGTGADDIVTLTAGDGNVTFVGNVTVGPDSATNNGYGTFLFRKTGASTWIGYRIG